MKNVLTILFLFPLLLSAQVIYADELLHGTVIGTDLYVDYSTSSASTTVNTREMAFDGNLNTFLATYERS